MASTMSAAVLEEYGRPFRLAAIARPSPRPGQVLVRIAASGTNPLDSKIRAGGAAHAKHPLPAVLGLDLAGIVEEVGEGVTSLGVGAAVYGMTGGVGGIQGTLAAYAAVDADLLSPKPASLSMRNSAALPLIAITAWEGIVSRIGLQSGQSILIQGGGGGVGHIAVQIARALGAVVFATGSLSSQAKIEQLGAHFIARDEPVAEYTARLTGGEGFDAVYDTAGGAALDASFAAVKRLGRVASCLGWGTHALAPLSFKEATYAGVFTLSPLLSGQGRKHFGDVLHRVAQMADAGHLAPTVDDRRFTLASANEAYDVMDAGLGRGKLVVEVEASP